MKERDEETVMGKTVMAEENVFATEIRKDATGHSLSPNSHLTLKLTELIL